MKRRRGETKLSIDKLNKTVDAAISSLGSAELAILQLLNYYDIHLDVLCRLLQDKGFNVSFSNVTYQDIAPRVGLKSELAGRDMPTFDIHRARISSPLFKEIIGDLQVIMRQYGDPDRHKNEAARSRFLAPLFDRIVALFDLSILNTPGSIIPGRMTTERRIEYQFLVFGGVSILVIEAIGTADEHFNAIAQLIAECDACDYANDRLDLSPSLIYGILLDGRAFESFAFDGSTKPPTFSRGVFRTGSSNPSKRLTIADYSSTSGADFIRSLRPICETIFYFFLLAYNARVNACTDRSIQNGIKSSPSWVDAKGHAGAALALAVDAAKKALARDNADSINRKTQEALDHLKDSLRAVPTSHKGEIDLLHDWNDEDFEYC